MGGKARGCQTEPEKTHIYSESKFELKSFIKYKTPPIHGDLSPKATQMQTHI